MDEVVKALKGLALFEGLSEEELGQVAQFAQRESVNAGDAVFSEGDPGDTLYVVLSGVVKITTLITEGVEKTLTEIREGGVFGEMVLLDPEVRSASAVAEQEVDLVALARDDLLQFFDSCPAVGVRILGRLSGTLAQRLRATTDAYRRNLQWSLEVSGSLSLNFHRLLTDSVEITVNLLGGGKLVGALLKVEQSAAGHELWLRCADERLAVVPYHAIACISFGSDVLTQSDTEEDASYL